MRKFLDFFYFRFGQLRGNDELRPFIQILRGIIVELGARYDLSSYRRFRLIIA